MCGPANFLIFNDSIIHRNAQPPARKSLIVSYLLWLVGGWFGIHHIYLGRDIQAFVWWSTFGGYFGMGWLVDFFRMPAMVREANEDPADMAKLVQKWHTQSKPDFSVVRYAFSFLVSYLYAQLILLVIPQEEVGGIDWGFLHWLVPLAGAIGMHDTPSNQLPSIDARPSLNSCFPNRVLFAQVSIWLATWADKRERYCIA